MVKTIGCPISLRGWVAELNAAQPVKTIILGQVLTQNHTPRHYVLVVTRRKCSVGMSRMGRAIDSLRGLFPPLGILRRDFYANEAAGRFLYLIWLNKPLPVPLMAIQVRSAKSLMTYSAPSFFNLTLSKQWKPHKWPFGKIDPSVDPNSVGSVVYGPNRTMRRMVKELVAQFRAWGFPVTKVWIDPRKGFCSCSFYAVRRAVLGHHIPEIEEILKAGNLKPLASNIRRYQFKRGKARASRLTILRFDIEPFEGHMHRSTYKFEKLGRGLQGLTN